MTQIWDKQIKFEVDKTNIEPIKYFKILYLDAHEPAYHASIKFGQEYNWHKIEDELI